MRKKFIRIGFAILIASFLLMPSVRTTQASAWSKVRQNDPLDTGIYNITAFNGYLYASTGNWGVNPVKVIRSSNGTSWTQVNSDGFGDIGNMSVTSMTVMGNYLYAATTNMSTGMELWRCSKSSLCDTQSDWVKVNVDGFGDSDNFLTYSIFNFNNYLFASTTNLNTGIEVWRCHSASGCDSQGDWAQVNSDGFGGPENYSARKSFAFKNYLYVFASNIVSGTEVWRCSAASDCDQQSDWAQVNMDGFGDVLNIESSSSISYNGTMYVGTYNNNGSELWKTTNGTSWTKITGPGFITADNVRIDPYLVVNNCIYLGTRSLSGTGGEVWKSCNNGITWLQDNTPGFGVVTNEEISSATVYGSYIYFGTWNPVLGGSIWRSAITPLSISTGLLPVGKVSSTYSKQLVTSSGTSTKTYSKYSGILPTGLSISTAGKISGKPTKAGKYTFRIKVVDSGMPTQTAYKNFTLTVFNTSIKINSNRSSTTNRKVKLTLSASDGVVGDIKYMRFSNNNSKWSSWKTYKKSYSNWDLTSKKYGGTTKSGTKRVYVQFKTANSTISLYTNDTIRYRR